MPVERLGIPAVMMTDGPNGARGIGSFESANAACFPAGIALAATWNTVMVERVGQALGQEARSKGARVLLAPTVNIHRSPLAGRNFECYSEDPYLTGSMAIAYIRGVQSQGVGATIKHFVCNDSEYERHTISSEVSERALHEIYLAPFLAAIKAAQPWAIMTAYNKVNGVYACDQRALITDLLKHTWSFDGVVMSDWHGTQSTADSVNAGQDLEMPGPSLWRAEKLLQAVAHHEVDEATIDDSVRRLLHLLERVDAFAHPAMEPEHPTDRPEHRQVAREAAAEGIVLLKNVDQILPLRSETVHSLAIIGPNAKTARIMGGGSAQVNSHAAITPYDAVVARAGGAVTVGYELGCYNHKFLPLIDGDQITSMGNEAEHGLTVEYFNRPDLTGEVVYTTLTRTTQMYWQETLPSVVDPQRFSVRATGNFTPAETGVYSFGLASDGFSRLFLDGQTVIDNWDQQQPGDAFFGSGSSEARATVTLTAGQAYALALEFGNGDAAKDGVRLGCLPPLPANALERAASLARTSEVALVFVGLSEEWESEGFDRSDIDLVGDQAALIARVAAANPKTVVVLNTGSAVAMPWLDQVAAVVQAWYPGEECGHAIADVLFGDVNPSGKLPQTFPVRLEDTPAFINYPGEYGQVHYGEGIFVGYRYYEKKKIAPLFPLGSVSRIPHFAMMR